MIFATQGTKQGTKPIVSAAAAAIKRRQALIAGGALVAVGLALIGAVAFMRAGKSQIGMGLPEKPVPLSVAPAGAGVDPQGRLARAGRNPDRPPGALGWRAHRHDEAAGCR